MNRPTKKRLEEIRHIYTSRHDTGYVEGYLIAEIDALIDDKRELQSDIKGWKTLYQDTNDILEDTRECNFELNNENQSLRDRIERLREVIAHVHQHADKEFGWGDLLNEGLKKDDEAAKNG